MLWIACLMGSSGCYRASYVDRTVVPSGPAQIRYVQFFLFGAIGRGDVDLRELCGDRKAASVVIGWNGLTSLATGLTVGLYTPRRIRVICGAPETARANQPL